MLTGRETLFSVEQAISGARTEEGQLEMALRSAMDEAARLRRTEAEAFRALARVRLDVTIREKVIGGLDDTEQKAVALIERHRAETAGLASKREEFQKKLDQAELDKHDCDQKLADALDAVDSKRHGTAERVKTEPNWLTAKAAVEGARKIATNADEKASNAEANLAVKGKPYENDQLFMYLWSKKHGQAEDRSGRFVRFFDRKVARLIGYNEARANYAMLREIPLRLREHAKNKQAEVEAALAEVVAIERTALVRDGIEPLEATVKEAQAAAKSAEESVAAITAQLQEIEAALQKELAEGDDAVYDRATDMLAQTLVHEDLRELYQSAVRTATKADDQAISSISKAREALQKAEGEIAQIRSEIRTMADRRIELEGTRDRARRAGYQDPRGTFGGNKEIIGSVIGGILQGALQGAALDRVLRDNYRFPVPRADSDFGGRWEAPSWPNSWNGGSADVGGQYDDGGGSGWRTGGGFWFMRHLRRRKSSTH